MSRCPAVDCFGPSESHLPSSSEGIDGAIDANTESGPDLSALGQGIGRDFTFHPDRIRLTGIDLSKEILALSRRRAAALGREVELFQGDAQTLRFPVATLNTVVCTFSLCSIFHERKAVAEMKRVLRPGGQLILIDYVPSTTRLRWGVQWLLEQVTVRVEGEHLLRRPLELVQAEGFVIERTERLKAVIAERVSARKIR